ncbi:MAG TPA: ATP-binding protein [Chitinophagaceae bacterium]
MNLKSPVTLPSAMHESVDLLRDAEELLQYGSWIWTPESDTMECSAGMYLLMGHSPASDNSKHTLADFLGHFPEDEADSFQKEIDVAFAKGTPFRFIHSVTNKEGRTMRVVSTGKVVNRNGTLSLMGVTQDITDNVLLQENVLKERKRMDQYELFLKFGTWQYSAATNQITWSAGMYNLFGYDAVKDKNLAVNEALYQKHIDPSDYEKGLLLKAETIQNRDEYFWQYRITTVNGENKWLETYGHTVRDKNGKFINTFGITRDITRLKLYEHSLEMKIRELNRSNSELEEFAYVASHDMQEPLRKLITFSERLTTKFSDVLQEEGQLYLNRMTAATKNMRLLIDNLLDFSRISRTGDEYEKTDLNEILQKVLNDLEVSIEETKAVIATEKLPVIEAQAPQMKQLFSNILSNALKFRKTSVPPQINISCQVLSDSEIESSNLEKRMKYFRIDIRDNGIGFEQEYAQRIFQIFQRLHGKAEYPGSGIGLAICKKIVDYHNGMIYAQGQMHEGAVITVILPEKQ